MDEDHHSISVEDTDHNTFDQVDLIQFNKGNDDDFFHGKRSREDEDDEEDLVLDYESNAKRPKISDAAAKKINNEQWNDMYERLKMYKQEYGDCLVPKRHSKEPKLGTWVETQRVQYKRLTRITDETTGTEVIVPNKRLNQERLDKLNEIGFAWTAKNARKGNQHTVGVKTKRPPYIDFNYVNASKNSDEEFEIMFQRLLEYKHRFGDCLVPRKWEEDPKLATWVETQRGLWNRDYGPKVDNRSGISEAQDKQQQSLGYVGKTPEEWAQIMDHIEQGATMEDAAEIGPIMADEAHHHHDDDDNEHHSHEHDSMVAAAAEHAAATVDQGMEHDELQASEEAQLFIARGKRLSPERKARLDEIGFVWSLRGKRIEDHWEEMFKQLVEYKEKHGDCLVPSRYEENLKLGKWVETQRYEYTKSQRPDGQSLQQEGMSEKPKSSSNPRLTEERRRRLESIGFEWKVKHKMKRYYEKQWNVMFEKLKKFREENGHTLVPKRYPEDQKLATWVHTQRVQYRKLMTGTSAADDGSDAGSEDKFPSSEEMNHRLTDERRRRLEEIDFVWSAREGDKTAERVTRNSYDSQWDSMFDRLVAYKAKYGDCLVPKRYPGDPRLGTWVDTQRVQYKKLQKKLEERSEGAPSTSEENIEIDDGNLGGESSTEVASESSRPVLGRLTDERIRRLEDIGFVWSLRDDWKKHYDELKRFKTEHGHCNVPARYSQNRRLGIWVSAQRQQYKAMSNDAQSRRSAPLTQERIDLLNGLGFTWTIRSRDALGESWNQRLQDLKKYKEIHGNCLVPSRYPPCPELGVWVGTQRTQYRLYMKAKQNGEKLSGSTSMNEERIHQLEEIGFVWAIRASDFRRDSLQAGGSSVGGSEHDPGEVVTFEMNHDRAKQSAPDESHVASFEV